MGTLGGSSWAEGLNNANVAVGYSVSSTDGTQHAFIWTAAEGMTDIFPTRPIVRATDINDIGTIVGETGYYGRAFRAGPSGWEVLDTVNYPSSSATSVNNNNEAVGAVADTSFAAQYVPMLWTASGQVVQLNPPSQSTTYGMAFDINDYGVVVGSSDFKPFRWTAAEGMVVLTAPSFNNLGVATGVNSSGIIVGSTNHPITGKPQASLWYADGTMIYLDTLGVTESFVEGINDSTQVVGRGWNTSGEEFAFVWDSVNGMQVLDDLFSPRAINNSGLMVGVTATEAVYSHVPNPDSVFSVSLTCSGEGGASPEEVVRGAVVRCAASWTPTSIPSSEITFEWTFQGDSIKVFPAVDAAAFDPPTPIVASQNGLDVWEGKAVLGGRVSLHASRQVDHDSSEVYFIVVPRSTATWGSLPVSLTPGFVDMATDYSQSLQDQPGPDSVSIVGLSGLNFDSVGGLSGADRMVRGIPQVASVPDGPNQGLGYIEHPGDGQTGDVRSTRSVAIRTWLSGREQPKFIYDRWPNDTLTARGLLQAMRSNAKGNKSKYGQDSTAFFLGVMGHETHGANGGKGHQGQIEVAASSLSTCGKIPAILEGVVGLGAIHASEIASIVLEEGRRSLLAATDHDHVYGNFGTVRTYQVVSAVTAVTHTYPDQGFDDDSQKLPSFDSAPDPRFKCSRVY